MAARGPTSAAVACVLVAALAGCESIVKFDHARIPSESSEAGTLDPSTVIPDNCSPGTLDSSFGNDGQRSLGPGIAIDVEYTQNGQLLVLGTESNGSEQALVLVRANGDGTLDESFGTFGVAQPVVGSTAVQLAVLADGSALAAGTNGGTGTIARFTPEGKLEPTFGAAGIISVPFAITSLSARSSGDFVVAGTSSDHAYVLRFTATGAIDDTFHVGGEFSQAFDEGCTPSTSPATVALTSDGTIYFGVNSTCAGAPEELAALERLDVDGTVVGSISGKFFDGTNVVPIATVVEDADGVLVGGGPSLGVLRLTPNGPDVNFGSQGLASAFSGVVTAIARDGLRNVLAVANESFGAQLVRYGPRGTQDQSFMSEIFGGDSSTPVRASLRGIDLVVTGYTVDSFEIARYTISCGN